MNWIVENGVMSHNGDRWLEGEGLNNKGLMMSPKKESCFRDRLSWKIMHNKTKDMYKMQKSPF